MARAASPPRKHLLRRARPSFGAADIALRGGTIDGNEARRRRRLLQRESQFYGAMDGAMKFVKRDLHLRVVADSERSQEGTRA
ncbi:MAG TPA: FHIPEP family type III secretion protein, partial [Gaiellaceae bacterium]|nr:FHIPEP family type III secretion protein [Gaiellaceae bacterium]